LDEVDREAVLGPGADDEHIPRAGGLERAEAGFGVFLRASHDEEEGENVRVTGFLEGIDQAQLGTRFAREDGPERGEGIDF
jgi:hypothetical protein